MTTDNYQVDFSPTNEQVDEIKKWLIAERQKTEESFYCNWNIIESSFYKNEMATISLNNKTVGFAIWQLRRSKIATIDIMEIKPPNRKRGIGKKLTTQLLNFFKNKGVCVVNLQCSPSTSKPFWKRLAFKEFPHLRMNYNFDPYDSDELYSILIEHLQTSTEQQANETIELWNHEQYTTNDDTPPTYIWNLEFIGGTRKLLKPIIHPAHYDWRLRWKINGETIKDDKIKYFNAEIDYRTFIIIDELIV